MPGPDTLLSQALDAIQAGDIATLERKCRHPRWSWEKAMGKGGADASRWVVYASRLAPEVGVQALDALAAAGWAVGDMRYLLRTAYDAKAPALFAWLLEHGSAPVEYSGPGGITVASYVMDKPDPLPWLTALARASLTHPGAEGLLSLWDGRALRDLPLSKFESLLEHFIAQGVRLEGREQWVCGDMERFVQRERPELFTLFEQHVQARLSASLPPATGGARQRL